MSVDGGLFKKKSLRLSRRPEAPARPEGMESGSASSKARTSRSARLRQAVRDHGPAVRARRLGVRSARGVRLRQGRRKVRPQVARFSWPEPPPIRYSPALARREPPGKAAFHFFFQAEDGIRDLYVTGVQTCALPI